MDGKGRCDGAPRFLASSRSSATRTKSFHFHRDRGNAYLLRCATDKGVTARRSRLTMTRNFDRGSDIHNLPLNSRTRANSTFHLAYSSRHLDVKTQPTSIRFDRYTWSLERLILMVIIHLTHLEIWFPLWCVYMVRGEWWWTQGCSYL